MQAVTSDGVHNIYNGTIETGMQILTIANLHIGHAHGNLHNSELAQYLYIIM